jgi:hypothetical protein
MESLANEMGAQEVSIIKTHTKFSIAPMGNQQRSRRGIVKD